MAVGVNYETKRCLKISYLNHGETLDQAKPGYINLATVNYAIFTREQGQPDLGGIVELIFEAGPSLFAAARASACHTFFIDNKNDFELNDLQQDFTPGLSGGTQIDYETKRCMLVHPLTSTFQNFDNSIYVALNMNNILYTKLVDLINPGVYRAVEVYFKNGASLRVNGQVAYVESDQYHNNFERPTYGYHSYGIFNDSCRLTELAPTPDKRDSDPEDSSP